ncbi:RabGAP/TBC [Microthyrium microscopicum]|uniref:GTPase-activating protein GYP5 n=1 Tax=Microthyrium microscopicum TaxID=703497 RepID=A0A6A6UB70_9PEZI|nr:RabGAP/TBC [Microthyrium microscopicum]
MATVEQNPPTTPSKATHDKSDEERDAFEDNTDITPKPRARSPAATRSLTERRPSSASSTSKDMKSIESTSTTVEEDKENTTRDDTIKKPLPLPRRTVVPKTENMDEVNLADDNTRSTSPSKLNNAVSEPKSTPVHLARTPSQDSQPHRYSDTSLKSPDKPPLAPSISDKAANMVSGRFKSPFSFFTRNQTEKKPSTVTSPISDRPHSMNGPRFDRANSTDGQDRNSQASLRDRFKAVRMREEAGIASVGEELVPDTPVSPALDDQVESPSANRRKSSSTIASVNPTINPNLAPGTAAGIAEGPRDDGNAVDWDLWQAVVTEGPAAVARTSSEELSHAIAAGIPQAIRGVIWQVLANSKNEEMEKFYFELVARGTEKERALNGHADTNGHTNGKESIASSASSILSEKSGAANGLSNSPPPSVEGYTNPQTPKPKSAKEEVAHIQSLEKVIKRDLGGRTSYSKYLMSSGLQDGLFGICKAYALYDEEVGYAQGMNFIAMPLLFNMREEEAFCLFVRLMSKYGLRDLFTQDMPGLHLQIYQFERLLEDFEPALYCHLNRRGVTPNLYATQWFLTLFAYRFPLQLVQRIYDLILSGSLELAILKFGLVLMQKNKAELLAMRDMSALSQFLKEKLFDAYIDRTPSSSSILESGFFGSTGGVDKEVYRADLMVQDAVALPVTEEMLRGYATEWEEKTRTERERETELEGLRSQCANLSVKVRRLEERVEKNDQEHVTVASELVRTKVDNETLLDENESLKGQVEELKAVVARQTEEVENRLRGEMDEVMKRNSEVHNANRAIEEEKSEMERDLVETKMKHAQINSEHEALKQRWNSIIQMMK